MPRTILLFTFLISLLIAGCAPSAIPAPLNTPALNTPTLNPPAPQKPASNLPALNDTWTIKMEQSGGIMGLLRSIEISSDGKFTVIDERSAKIVTGEFSSDRLSKIKEQVSSSEYIPPSGPNGMVCADCFIYDLEIQGDGGNFTVQLNDINLPNSGLEPLVTYLRSLIEMNLE